MEIKTITKPSGLQVQQAQVEIALGGVTKLVTIERYSDEHCWSLASQNVVVRFSTGKKEHVVGGAVASNKTGTWRISVQGFRNRNNCYPVRWANENEQGSGWTS